MQNLGGQTKSIMVFSGVVYIHLSYIGNCVIVNCVYPELDVLKEGAVALQID